MSSTAIDFPKDRTELDPALNTGPFTGPLQTGDVFVSAGTSYVWRQDSGETYGRWRNEDPGASGDGRYVLKNPTGNQVINGEYELSINDKIKLQGSDGSATFAGSVNANRPDGSTSDGFAVRSGTKKRFGVDAGGSLKLSDDIANDGTVGVELKADGSATFAGGLAEINDVGQVYAAGLLADNVSSDNSIVFRGKNTSGTVTSLIRADGTATFADSVNIMGADDPLNRVNITASTGEIFCATDKTDDTAMIRVQGGRGSANQNDNVVLNADGSAEFAAQVSAISLHGQYSIVTTEKTANQGIFVGSDSSTAPTSANSNIHLKGDGSATFANTVTVEDSSGVNFLSKAGGMASPENFRFFKGEYNGTETSRINADGSATFAGTVTSNNITRFSARLLERVESSTTLEQLKTGIKEALALLVPSTMPAPEPEPEPTPSPSPQPTPEPTPTDTNLIPDDWTHIEKLKALKELIAEMDL